MAPLKTLALILAAVILGFLTAHLGTPCYVGTVAALATM